MFTYKISEKQKHFFLSGPSKHPVIWESWKYYLTSLCIICFVVVVFFSVGVSL